MIRRTLTTTALAAALALTATGCGSDEPKTLPTETPTSSTPTPTKAEWESKFKEEDLAAYKNALEVWQNWEKASAPIWADPKETKEAQATIEKYWVTPQPMLQRLSDWSSGGLQILGEEKVTSSEMTSSEKGTVVIRQCIDHSAARVLVKGAEQPKSVTHPFLREIYMTQWGDALNWKILRVKDPSTKWVKRCSG